MAEIEFDDELPKYISKKDLIGWAEGIEKLFPQGNTKVEVFVSGDFVSFNVLVQDKKTYIDLLTLGRSISPDEIDLDLMAIDRSLQGKGIAKELHKLQYKLARKWGIKKYHLHANVDVGGYAWWKYGMVPTDMDRMARRILRHGTFLKEKGRAGATTLLNHYANLEKLSDSEKVEYIRNNLDELKIGLLNSSWRGELDLNDERSRKLFEDYIGFTPDDIDENLLVERQVVLERLKSGVAVDYEVLAKRLDSEIRDLLRDGSLTDRELRYTLIEMRKRVNELYSEQYEETMEKLRSIFSVEDVWNSEVVFGIITNDTWELALRAPIQATGELLEPFVKNLSSRQIKRLEAAILTGRAQGQTISQITSNIRGTRARNFRDGVIRKGLDDARTVVRTAVQHVATQARVASWDQMDIDSYRWVSTLDGKTSSSCRSLDSQVFKLNKGPLPPIHPNCRSTVIPDFGDPLGTRSSLDGRVQADTSYYEWLKGRTPDFQDEVLGPTRAKLLRDGGLSAEEFTDLQLNKNFKPLTLEEMRELKPKAFKRANI